jgi:hypothetical protein
MPGSSTVPGFEIPQPGLSPTFAVRGVVASRDRHVADVFGDFVAPAGDPRPRVRVPTDDIARWFNVQQQLVNAGEAEMLYALNPYQQYRLNEIQLLARTRGIEHDPGGNENGAGDAFRHIYWHALMTREFGAEFADAFGRAHENVPANDGERWKPNWKQATFMDMWNNNLGIQIALQHPNATPQELERVIGEAIGSGDAVVLDQASGEPRRSNG